MQITNLAVEALTQDAFNPRRTHDEKTIDALAERIAASGVLVPLIVRPKLNEAKEELPGGVVARQYSETYTVLCGSRRLAASKKAKLEQVPCIIQKLTDAQAAEVALTEQDSHESLHFLELAEALLRWKEAGATPDDMGAKIHRLRATVYSMLGLNKLTPESKRACWDGKLEETAARGLATVPAKLQGLALKDMLAPGEDGKPKTVREQLDLLRTKWRLDLKKMPFDTADATLSPEAGSCETCSYRSGVQPELLADTGHEYLCLNPPCCQTKLDAHWARRVDDGEHGRGPRCLPDAEAKKVFTDHGLREDARFLAATAVCHEDAKGRTYKELLGKAPDKHLMLARVPSTRQVVELVPTADLKKTLDEVGLIKRRAVIDGRSVKPAADEPELTPKERKEEKAKTERREQVKRRVIAAIVAKVRTREPDKRFWRTLADSLVHTGGLEHIWARRDVQEEPGKYLDRLDGPDLRGFVWEGLLEFELYGEAGKYSELMLEQAKVFGVEVKEHEREVMAEEKAKPEVRKAKVKA